MNASNRSRSFLRAAALLKFAPMANCSIPNSTLATGRISMPSSARSKKLNRLFLLLSFGVGCSTLSFGRLLFLWRVKGAWWPSRSSKPSSVRMSRGRFDSCPLRLDLRNSCSRFALRNGHLDQRATASARISKGGEHSCRANKSVN